MRKRGNIIIERLPTWVEVVLVIVVFMVLYFILSGDALGYIKKIINWWTYWR